jgi:hypothetical protein
MSRSADDVLSQTSAAARRLEIQDPQFACRSERYLEVQVVGSNDLVVNLAYGLGGLTRRILWRLVPYGADSEPSVAVGSIQPVCRNWFNDPIRYKAECPSPNPILCGAC